VCHLHINIILQNHIQAGPEGGPGRSIGEMGECIYPTNFFLMEIVMLRPSSSLQKGEVFQSININIIDKIGKWKGKATYMAIFLPALMVFNFKRFSGIQWMMSALEALLGAQQAGKAVGNHMRVMG
jgi:hypothetical protein